MKKGGDARPFCDAPRPDSSDDVDEFERAMADVVRLPPDPRGRMRPAPPVGRRSPVRTPAAQPDEHDGDYSAPGIDRRELRKLRRGEYVVGAELDLHGLRAADASARVRLFLEASRCRGYRCVRIVHGRGLHSDGKAAILKPRVREYLRAQPAVLAYAEVPRSGGGALHVLLRK